MPDGRESAVEFQRRRWIFIRGLLWRIGIAAAGFGLTQLAGRLQEPSAVAYTVAGLVTAVGLFALLFWTIGAGALYTCPKCNTMPMTDAMRVGGHWFGWKSQVDLNSDVCRKCGAALK